MIKTEKFANNDVDKNSRIPFVGVGARRWGKNLGGNVFTQNCQSICLA